VILRVLQRLGILVVSLLASSVLVFAFMAVLPGDPARVALGVNASDEAVAQLREQFGLDRPLVVQYLDWLGGLLTFRLGNSYVSGAAIGPQVADRLQVTLWLVLTAAIPLLGASALIVFGNRTRRAAIAWLGLTDGRDDLRSWVKLAGQALSFAIALVAIVVIMALVYYFGPNRKQTFRGVLPGAFLATILWLLYTLAVGWYLRDIANYNVLYGGVGAGLALLVWSYVLSVITLFGCAYNAVYERR